MKKIELVVPDGIYNIYGLYNAINNKLHEDSQTENSIIYSTFDRGVEYSVFQTCINQKYTAEDYILSFYNERDTETQNVQTITSNSFSSNVLFSIMSWQIN